MNALATNRCTFESHAEATSDPDRIRAEWRFNYIYDDEGFDIFEVYDCPHCRSSLSIRAIGPVKEGGE